MSNACIVKLTFDYQRIRPAFFLAVVKKTAAKPAVGKVEVKKIATAKATPAEAKPTKKAVVKEIKESVPKQKNVAASPEHRYHMIATAAYFLAQGRGFAGGYEMQDWITAEHQIDAQLKS